MDANYPVSRYSPYFKGPGPINYSQNSSYNDLYQNNTIPQQCPAPTDTRSDRNIIAQSAPPLPPSPSEPSLYYHHTHYKTTTEQNSMLHDSRQSNKINSAACYSYGTAVPIKDNYYPPTYYDQYKYCSSIGIPPTQMNTNVGQYSTKSAATVADYHHNTVPVSHQPLPPPPPPHVFQTASNKTAAGIISSCEKNLFPSKISNTASIPTTTRHPSIHPNTNVSHQYMYGYGYGAAAAAAVAVANQQHSNQNLCNYPPPLPPPSSQNCNEDTRWMWDEYQNSRRMVSSSYLSPHHSFPTANHSSLKDTSDIYRSNHHYTNYYTAGHHSLSDQLSQKDKLLHPPVYHHQMSSQTGTVVNSGDNSSGMYSGSKGVWPLYQTIPPSSATPQNMIIAPSTYDRLNYYTDGQNSNYCPLNQEKSSSNFYQNYAAKYIPSSHAPITPQRMAYKAEIPVSSNEMQITKEYCNSYRCGGMQYNEPTINMENHHHPQHIYAEAENSMHYSHSEIINSHSIESITGITEKHCNDLEMKTVLNCKEYTTQMPPIENSLNEHQNDYQQYNQQNAAMYNTGCESDGASSMVAENSSNSVLNRSQNLREFLSTWNEDEEDVVDKIEIDIDGNHNNSGCSINSGTISSSSSGSNSCCSINENVYMEHTNIEVTNNIENTTLENHLQFRGSFKTRPKIHVGITVDGNISSDQYINLPDIIIDIEKSKDNENNVNALNNTVGSNNTISRKIEVQDGNEEITINTATRTTTNGGIIEHLNMTTALENLFEDNNQNLDNKLLNTTIIDKSTPPPPPPPTSVASVAPSMLTEIEMKHHENSNNDEMNILKSHLEQVTNETVIKQIDTIAIKLMSDNQTPIKNTTSNTKQLKPKKKLKSQQHYSHNNNNNQSVQGITFRLSRKHECKGILKCKNTTKKKLIYRKCCNRAVMLHKLRKNLIKNCNKQNQNQKTNSNKSNWIECEIPDNIYHYNNPISLNIACISVINSKQFHEYLKLIYDDNQEKVQNNDRIQKENNDKLYDECTTTNTTINVDDKNVNANNNDANDELKMNCQNLDTKLNILINENENENDDDVIDKIELELKKLDNDIESEEEIINENQTLNVQKQQEETIIRWFVPKLSDLCEYALKYYYDKGELILKIDDVDDEDKDDNNECNNNNDDDDNNNNNNNIDNFITNSDDVTTIDTSSVVTVSVAAANNNNNENQNLNCGDITNKNEQYSTTNLLFVECDINENIVENLENCVISDDDGSHIEVNLVHVIETNEEHNNNNDDDDDEYCMITNKYNEKYDHIELSSTVGSIITEETTETETESLICTSIPLTTLTTELSSSILIDDNKNDNDNENITFMCDDNDVNIDIDDVNKKNIFGSHQEYNNNLKNHHYNNINNNNDNDNDNNNNINNNSNNKNIINNNNNNNIPSILHHEEIVPENLKIFKNKQFIKYLQSKYVQKIDYFRTLIINKIIKKYKKQFICINLINKKLKKLKLNKLLKNKRKNRFVKEQQQQSQQQQSQQQQHQQQHQQYIQQHEEKQQQQHEEKEEQEQQQHVAIMRKTSFENLMKSSSIISPIPPPSPPPISPIPPPPPSSTPTSSSSSSSFSSSSPSLSPSPSPSPTSSLLSSSDSDSFIDYENINNNNNSNVYNENFDSETINNKNNNSQIYKNINKNNINNDNNYDITIVGDTSTTDDDSSTDIIDNNNDDDDDDDDDNNKIEKQIKTINNNNKNNNNNVISICSSSLIN